jgi:hypothetical protein
MQHKDENSTIVRKMPSDSNSDILVEWAAIVWKIVTCVSQLAWYMFKNIYRAAKKCICARARLPDGTIQAVWDSTGGHCFSAFAIKYSLRPRCLAYRPSHRYHAQGRVFCAEQVAQSSDFFCSEHNNTCYCCRC